ncbi:SET domain-containing protein-lysine N-methyltransferase [Paraburkholderia agricolaris]|uniref:SET domain-containing protein-lysine N-methyltransferase n=1 Tax=Paraburkholderia agricolaris TaxID=2152888 RepID=UPI0038BB4D14
MLHPDVRPALSDLGGLGLRATNHIPCGTAIWAPSDESLILSSSEVEALPAATYQWTDELGYRTKTGQLILLENWGFLFNHSCDPNVLDFSLDFGIAVRDIEDDQELTIDYGSFPYDPPFRFPCKCGAANCTQWTENRSTDGNRPRLVRLVSTALSLVGAVRQPLHSSLLSSSISYKALCSGVSIERLPDTSVCRHR